MHVDASTVLELSKRFYLYHYPHHTWEGSPRSQSGAMFPLTTPKEETSPKQDFSTLWLSWLQRSSGREKTIGSPPLNSARRQTCSVGWDHVGLWWPGLEECPPSEGKAALLLPQTRLLALLQSLSAFLAFQGCPFCTALLCVWSPHNTSKNK